MERIENLNDGNGLWIFGYGSLCWNPGFEYKRSMIGCVKGFDRKFWQGNTTHRGTIKKPGRVVTLVENKESIVWGRAFQLQNDSALPYLQNRECSLGGYMTAISTFYSRSNEKSFPVLIYIATNKNQHWLGEAPLHKIAQQITECSGPSGHNVEYLLRLADFMRRYFPEIHDDHLFTLEIMVRSKIKEENLCLENMLGPRGFNFEIEDIEREPRADVEGRNDGIRMAVVERPRENTFQYTSIVPLKKLRCLKP